MKDQRERRKENNCACSNEEGTTIAVLLAFAAVREDVFALLLPLPLTLVSDTHPISSCRLPAKGVNVGSSAAVAGADDVTLVPFEAAAGAAEFAALAAAAAASAASGSGAPIHEANAEGTSVANGERREEIFTDTLSKRLRVLFVPLLSPPLGSTDGCGTTSVPLLPVEFELFADAFAVRIGGGVRCPSDNVSPSKDSCRMSSLSAVTTSLPRGVRSSNVAVLLLLLVLFVSLLGPL